ncbi:MAG TPA: hypothetical protein VN807_01505 [Candidatus Sulfotelmatobacter sp.]|nr:hypothetical protein [Candidatus Sulfotelmatobacter sp.]
MKLRTRASPHGNRGNRRMSPRATIRDWARLIYYLSQNILSLVGVVLTTSSAITLIGFWVYDFMLPGPPHPYVGILLFLILPGVFLLGLLLIPAGIFLRRRKLSAAGELPTVYPAIELGAPMVRHGLLFIGVAPTIAPPATICWRYRRKTPRC